jgi:peptidoglycan/xylan/chitin deacetylase (PgdA/CDA1 family)
MPCTFGIIPYVAAGDLPDPHPQEVVALSEEKAGTLKRAVASGSVEPALHGYSHQTIRDCRRGGCTEFSGASYHSQMEKMSQGKRLLEDRLGTSISAFVPPWNSYDRNTLRCVEDLGFDSISADLRGVTDSRSSLKFLPATCGVPELRQAIDSARRSSDPEPVIVVLFHAYDFIEFDGRGRFNYHDFARLLAWVASQEDVRARSISEAVQRVEVGADLFRKNKGCYLADRLIPPLLKHHLGFSHVYFSPRSVTNMQIRLWTTAAIFAFLTLLVSAGAAFLTGVFLFRQSALLASSSRYLASALLVLLSAYVLRDSRVFYGGLTALAAMLGICMGVWRASLRKTRRCP